MKTNKLMSIAAMLIMTIPFHAGAQVSIGTRQGITFSTLSQIGNLYDNNQIAVSYTGGIFANIPVKGALAFQPELNYIRKGRCSETELSGTSQETDCNYNYLQVPVMMRYTADLTGKSSTKIFFNAGPYAAFLFKTESKLKSGEELPANTLTDNHKDPDLGFILGGGITVPLSKFRIQLDLRYDMGLTKLNNQPDDFRTKSLSLAAGILF